MHQVEGEARRAVGRGSMTPNIPLAVRNLIDEYRSFLRTRFRFLDDHLRRQFEEHLAQADVVVGTRRDAGPGFCPRSHPGRARAPR